MQHLRITTPTVVRRQASPKGRYYKSKVLASMKITSPRKRKNDMVRPCFPRAPGQQPPKSRPRIEKPAPLPTNAPPTNAPPTNAPPTNAPSTPALNPARAWAFSNASPNSSPSAQTFTTRDTVLVKKPSVFVPTPEFALISVSEPVSEPASKPVSEPASELASKSVPEPVLTLVPVAKPALSEYEQNLRTIRRKREKIIQTAQASGDWNEMYAPRTVNEVIGHQKTKNALATWMKTWRDQGTVPLLLTGDPGIGKTTLVAAFLHACDVDVHFLGDDHDFFITNFKGIVSSKLYEGNVQPAVVVDNLEALSPQERTQVLKIIAKTKTVTTRPPIVFITNNAYAPALKTFRSACTVVTMYPPHNLHQSTRLRLHNLEMISKHTFPVQKKQDMVNQANGDLRKLTSLAQTNAQMISTLGLEAMQKNTFNTPFVSCKTLLTPGPVSKSLLEDYALDTMLPAFVAHNTPTHVDTIEQLDQLNNFYSLIDVLDSHPMHELHSVAHYMGVRGTHTLIESSGVRREILRPKIQFPALLGKTSSQNSTRDHIQQEAIESVNNPLFLKDTAISPCTSTEVFATQIIPNLTCVARAANKGKKRMTMPKEWSKDLGGLVKKHMASFSK